MLEIGVISEQSAWVFLLEYSCLFFVFLVDGLYELQGGAAMIKQDKILQSISGMCAFSLVLVPLSIFMFHFRVYGLILSALTFAMIANFSLAKCFEYRQETKARGVSLPWWKEWNILLFILGFIMGVVGFFINWLIGLSFHTVWIFLVGFDLVGASAPLPIRPSKGDRSIKEILALSTEELLASVKAELKDQEKRDQE